MWELPLTAFIVMAGLILLKNKETKSIEARELSDQMACIDTRIDFIEKDVQDYKKRVDSLTLRAGFKL